MTDLIPVNEFFAAERGLPVAPPLNIGAQQPEPEEDIISVNDLFNQEREPEVVEEKGFLGRSADILRERGAQIQERVAVTGGLELEEGEQSFLETGVQISAGGARAASQILGEGLKVIIDTPAPQLGGFSLKQVGDALGIIAPKNVKESGQEAANFASEVVTAYNQNLDAFNKESPRAGRNFQAVRELGDLLPLKLKGVRAAVGEIAEEGAGAIKTLTAPKEVPSLFGDVAEKGLADTSALSNLRSSIVTEGRKRELELFGTKDADGNILEEGLFDKAQRLGSDVTLNSQVVDKFSKDISKDITNAFGEESKGVLRELVDGLGNLTKLEAGAIGVGGTTRRTPTLNDLELIRRGLSAQSRAGTPAAATAGKLAKRMDIFLKSNKDQLKGSKEGLDIWQRAIEGRRDFAVKFEEPAVIAKALSDGTDETIEQAFIGTGRVALNKELANVYNNVLRALPSNQRQLAGLQLRQAIVNRWIKNSAKAIDTDDAISADNMLSQIKNFRNENQSMWKNFPLDERKVLVKLEKDLGDIGSRGALDLIADSVVKIARTTRLARGLETPRIFRPKKVVSVDELLNLTKIPRIKESK